MYTLCSLPAEGNYDFNYSKLLIIWDNEGEKSHE
jgi:hypothetical protein